MASSFPAQASDSQPRLEINESQFFTLLTAEWEPGQHIGICAPTGWGKTWLLARVMPLRYWSVIFALKQEDESIERFRGYAVIDAWKDRRYNEHHVIVWPDTRGMTPEKAEDVKLKAGRAVSDAVFMERHWTYGIDDLNDACAIGLKRKISSMLRLCRSQKTSLVVAYQRPFDIIQEALSQVSWTLASYHKDKRDIERIAEANGLSPKEALAVNARLHRFDFIVFRPMEEPIIVRRSGSK